jgi:hypothetical protein
VEEGKEPERLEGRIRGSGKSAELCVWPQKMVVVGEGFGCQ